MLDEMDDKILLIKEKIKKKNLPLWNIIKGSYDAEGNETIFDAAVRECFEEASVKVKLTHSSGVYVSKDQNKAQIQFNFLGKILEGKPIIPDVEEQSSRDESIHEIKWFSRSDLLKMDSNEFISNRTYKLIHDWIGGKKYPLQVFKQIEF